MSVVVRIQLVAKRNLASAVKTAAVARAWYR